MPYQGYTDEDLLDMLAVIDQTAPMVNQFDRAFIDNTLEAHDTYGHTTMTNKQRAYILQLKERYLVA